MQLLERREESSSCTLPAWFVYIAYVICFLLCVTSVVLVIMYGQKFGADVALQWILALLFCIAMSFIIIEPLKVCKIQDVLLTQSSPLILWGYEIFSCSGSWCLLFNNISVISWWSVLLLEETRVPGENHRPVTSH